MAYRAAVITVSDKGFRGERIDTSGPALCALLKENGFEIACTAIVPDEIEAIREELLRCADQLQIPLILTTGGTGFAERDVTPEATKEVITRETPGIPEAMRAESMRITPRGCLSRSAAGIRGKSLIINLPGSEKAAKENLNAVLPALSHGLKILASEGSADCAAEAGKAAGSAAAAAPSSDADATNAAEPAPGTGAAAMAAAAPSSGADATNAAGPAPGTGAAAASNSASAEDMSGKRTPPSMDRWMFEAKADFSARNIGMYLTHNGKVRATPRAFVRDGVQTSAPVTGMIFFADEEKVSLAVKETFKMDGVHYVRTWFNKGHLNVGDDIMFVLIGGDTRPHTIAALEFLVGKIKSECVAEQELFS